MDLLSQRLQEEIKAFTSGDGNSTALDQAIATTQELLEKLFILRYKSYEAGVYKLPSEQIPEFDFANVTSDITHLDDAPIQQEISIDDAPKTVELTDVIQEPEIEPNPKVDALVELDPTDESVSISIADEPPIQAETNTDDPVSTATPIDLYEIINQSHGKHEKIDKFNGNYSLKEKITFINELFKGSSESFASAVKQVDTHQRIDELMPTLNYLSVTNEWASANRNALEKFIQKVVAKYAE